MTAPKLDIADLPDWPRLLSSTQAAAYCGISVGMFEAHIAPEVRPIRLGARILYDRTRLDSLIDRKQGVMEGFSDPQGALDAL